MAEFQSYYRCTLCKDRFFGDSCTNDQEEARKGLLSNLGYSFTQISLLPEPRFVHECYNGSVGVAELLGMKIKKG